MNETKLYTVPSSSESWNVSTTEHLMVTIKASAVSDITKICLKIDADKIINDIKRRQIPRFADAPIGKSTSDCIEMLQKESNFELFNWLKDFKIQDMSLLTDLQQMSMLLNEIQSIGSLSAVDFKTSFTAVYDRQVIEEELKARLQKYCNLCISFGHFLLCHFVVADCM